MEELMPTLHGVRRHEHLARLASREPGAVAFVALRRAHGPGLAPVRGGKEGVVGKVDPRVVDVVPGIFGE